VCGSKESDQSFCRPAAQSVKPVQAEQQSCLSCQAGKEKVKTEKLNVLLVKEDIVLTMP